MTNPLIMPSIHDLIKEAFHVNSLLFTLTQALITIITYVFGEKGEHHNNNNNSSFETSSSPPSSSSSSSSSGSLNESMSCSRYMPSCGEDDPESGNKLLNRGHGDCNGIHQRSKPTSPHPHPETRVNGVAAISVGADSGILGDINPSMSTLNHCCDLGGKKFCSSKNEQNNCRNSKCKKKHCDPVVNSQEVSPLLSAAPSSTYGSGNDLKKVQPQLWTVKV